MNSKPESDLDLYGSRQQIISDWTNGHVKVCELLQSADDSIFEQPVQLDRWAQMFRQTFILTRKSGKEKETKLR